ncbi:hypothetical protein Pint_11709 [Pistacia integerrima]|uniref:Uncharacterized protein n=1 Tax=Pistacia integerrima TaxID=434235 RepID=A0ACC0XK33_9ROSI|nr:hypothetical protein Pint_11709 [Pistacia integerrima]
MMLTLLLSLNTELQTILFISQSFLELLITLFLYFILTMAKMAPAKSSQVGMVVVFVAVIFLMMSIQLAFVASESDDTLPVFKFGRRLAQTSYVPTRRPWSPSYNDEKP